MYVCNCHGIREAEISQSIRTGATTLRALREVLGVGTCCGKCVCDVRSQLKRELVHDGECTGCGRCKGASVSEARKFDVGEPMAVC